MVLYLAAHDALSARYCSIVCCASSYFLCETQEPSSKPIATTPAPGIEKIFFIAINI
jgi:hypothetical protein